MDAGCVGNIRCQHDRILLRQVCARYCGAAFLPAPTSVRLPARLFALLSFARPCSLGLGSVGVMIMLGGWVYAKRMFVRVQFDSEASLKNQEMKEMQIK